MVTETCQQDGPAASLTQADKLDLRDLGQVVEAAREAVGGGGGARAHVVNKHHWRVGKVQTYKSKSVKKINIY